MTASDLVHPWLTLAGPSSGDLLTLTPERAGWTYCGLRIIRLEPGELRRVETGPEEVFVLPLAGGLTMEVAPTGNPTGTEARIALNGRASTFSRVSDFAYVGRDSTMAMVSAYGAEVALPSARCETRRPPKYGPAQDVPVELRGAGPSTRQVNGFGIPGVWDHAEKLIAVEVLTPAGNWSSYPPHKHDVTTPCPVANEEIYFYKIGGHDQLSHSREGFGLHRTYTGPEHEDAGLAPLDAFAEVRDGDVALVPYGYHGPCVAAPGYPMYYLNVMAGPAADRSMAYCDDPTHGWVRDSWVGMSLDPRCPLTSFEGRLDGLRLPAPPTPAAGLPRLDG